MEEVEESGWSRSPLYGDLIGVGSSPHDNLKTTMEIEKRISNIP